MLIARNHKDCQNLLDVLGRFLSWTRTIKAQLGKCKNLIINARKTEFSNTSGKFSISNCPIPEMGSEPVKFLGRNIYHNLKENKVQKQVKEILQNMLEITDKDPINGPSKAWIYNNMIVQKLSWEFTVYDFPLTSCGATGGKVYCIH